MKSPFGRNVRKYREMLGWTQTELARRAKVRQGTISKIESGDMEGRYLLRRKIAKALGVNLGILEFEGDDDEHAAV